MAKAMTMGEKILAKHSGKDFVSPGDLITAKVDIILANDITGPQAIKIFEELGAETIFDKDAIAFVPDHFVPAKDIKSAEQAKIFREFARKHKITHYFEVGRMGIEHALLPDEGVVTAGDLIIGGDSHTCTYGALGAFATGVGSTDVACAMATGETWFKVPETMRVNFEGQLDEFVSGKDLILYLIGTIGVDGAIYEALEFGGSAIQRMGIDGRLTMCNMAIEAGAKTGYVIPDATTEAYLKGRSKRPYQFYTSDAGCEYSKVLNLDVSKLEPQVAFPHLPENTRPISQVGTVKIDQVLVGSCTNGRLPDLEVTAKILRGNKVHPDTRLIVIPGTQEIYLAAMEKGYIRDIIEAGGVVSTPTCGPCLGGHMGILARGEKAVSTTNRNFVGRMGHSQSEIYLASPAIAAASAVLGRIGHPREI